MKRLSQLLAFASLSIVGCATTGCEQLKEIGGLALETAAEVAKDALTQALQNLADKNPAYASAIGKVSYRLQVPFSAASTDADDYLSAIEDAASDALGDDELQAEFKRALEAELRELLNVPASGGDISLLTEIAQGL